MKAFTSSRNAKVDTIIQNGVWKWSEGRKLNEDVKRLMEETPVNLMPKVQQKDQLHWVQGGTHTFTVASAAKH